MVASASQNPSEVMIIRKINPSITVLSVPFWRFGRVKIGGRGTLVRLHSGGVAVFSPVALTPEVKETVTSLGELKYIAALDIEHHMYLGPWHEAYPDAKVIGPEGLPEKRAKQKNENVPFATIISEKNKETVQIDPEFDAEFNYEFVSAHTNKELAFVHKPTKTLIQADLLFNLPAVEQFSKTEESATTGIFTKLFTALNNTQGPALGQKRFIWYAMSSGDRPSYNKSITKINSWDFDTIIPCHGNVIESGGKGVFRKVFEWHLQGLNESKKDT